MSAFGKQTKADPGQYGRTPEFPGIQEQAESEAFASKRLQEKAVGVEDSTRETLTSAEMQVDSKLPPFLRTNNRYSYVQEYIQFWWRGEKIHWALFVFWLAAAIFTFTVFPLGSLLLFALAGRFRDMAYQYRFVANMFGVNRTIMVVD